MLDSTSDPTLFGAAEPGDNVVAEHRGVRIALTPDCKFQAVASELFDGGKYHSLANIRKAIDARLLAAARLRWTRTVRLPALDGIGDECEITGVDDDGELIGLPFFHPRVFYPRAGWIAAAIARARALEAEQEALEERLGAVRLLGWLSHYQGNDRGGPAPDQLFEFDRLLVDFERKRLLAEAGDGAADRQVEEELKKETA